MVHALHDHKRRAAGLFIDEHRNLHVLVAESAEYAATALRAPLALAFPVELRKVVYTTNAIESLNARFRRAVRHRGHFPNEQSAMKVLYLVAITRRANRENMSGKISGWKHILNTLSIHYGDRITAAAN